MIAYWFGGASWLEEVVTCPPSLFFQMVNINVKWLHLNQLLVFFHISGTAATIRGGDRHTTEGTPSPVYGGMSDVFSAGPHTTNNPLHHPQFPPRVGPWHRLDMLKNTEQRLGCYLWSTLLPCRVFSCPRTVPRQPSTDTHQPSLSGGADCWHQLLHTLCTLSQNNLHLSETCTSMATNC